MIHHSRDGTGSDASGRQRHYYFEKEKELELRNCFITGSAMLNDAGKMTGSMMVMQFGAEETWCTG